MHTEKYDFHGWQFVIIILQINTLLFISLGDSKSHLSNPLVKNEISLFLADVVTSQYL